jgi:hypothetical protein
MSVTTDVGTSTISILAALQQHRNVMESRAQAPIDLLAAILSITIDHEIRKVDIVVGDYSLKRHQLARVHLWRLNINDMDKCIAFRKGDIVRFNGVSIRKAYSTTPSPTTNGLVSEQPNQGTAETLTCLCDFHYSFLNPNIGTCFAKIATGFGRHMIIEANINRSLETPKSLVDCVGQWFKDNNSEICYFDEHRNEHCRRALSELTTPNLLSDIVVQVMQIDIDGAWKDKQRGYTPNNGNVKRIRVILMDSEDVKNEKDCMPLFIASSNPLLNQIRECFRRRRSFHMRQVLTNRNNLASAHDDIFLVLTSKSSIEIALPSPSGNITKRPRHSNEDGNVILTPLSAATSDRKFPSSQEATRFTVISSLESIAIEGSDILLTVDYNWANSPNFANLLTTIGEDGDVCYRNALITIHGKGNTCTSTNQAVFACRSIISTLCGSHNPLNLRETKSTEKKATKLIMSLLQLRAPLKWNLYCAPDTNIVHVESVALLALDF